MKIRSKKEIEENKLKKQKVLKILKRILDITIYSWALILTIGLIVGSCSKKTNGSTKQQKPNINQLRVNDVPYQDYYTYEFQFGSRDYDRTELEFLFMPNINHDSYNIVPAEADNYNQYYSINVENFYVLPKANTNQNELVKVTQIVFITKPVTYQSSSSSTGWKGIDRLASINFYCEADNYVDHEWSFVLFNKVNQQAVSDAYQYNVDGYDYYFVTPNISANKVLNTSDILFDRVFRLGEMLNFHLNSILNVNIGVGGTGDIGVKRPSNSGSDILYEYYIDTGVFISNGKTFNRICLTYRFVTSDSAVFGALYGKDDYQLFNVGYGTFVYMSYEYYVSPATPYSITVLDRNSIYHNASGNMREYYTSELMWRDRGYQSISFTQIDSTSYGEMVWLNNGYDTGLSGGSIVDVFSLLTTAFNSLVGLMSITIIPGFTIGVLLFIPVVVGLIIVVFRMVKK